MKIVGLEQLLTKQQQSGESYLEWLRVDAMSAGIYVLEPGERDLQEPHHEDEIYFVVEGEGSITVAGERSPVRAGSTVFVPAEIPHRFHSISQRLTLFVFFAPAESAGGG
ncbi:MAG: cupin domain-containing protein [Actinomycetota bacterium]|nr:cupin domain-containing protein [Actinomycetota bacterium]